MKTRRLNKVLEVVVWRYIKQERQFGGQRSGEGYPLHPCYIRFVSLPWGLGPSIFSQPQPAFGKMIHILHHSQRSHTRIFQPDSVISCNKSKLRCKVSSRPCQTTAIFIPLSECHKQLFWRKTSPLSLVLVKSISTWLRSSQQLGRSSLLSGTL